MIRTTDRELNLSNRNFIEQENFSLNCADETEILQSLRKYAPIATNDTVYSESDIELAHGTATSFHIPLVSNKNIGRTQYHDRVRFNSVIPEIEIVVYRAVGWVSQYDHTEQEQYACMVMFKGCKTARYGHRTWLPYTNNYHYGYKFFVSDLFSYDIAPCLRTFYKDFKEIVGEINYDIIEL